MLFLAQRHLILPQIFFPCYNVNMIRGTRIITGTEAQMFRAQIEAFTSVAQGAGYKEIMLPSMWEQKTWVEKEGSEILGQMYTFNDKGGREICLIPEATALIQEVYREQWSKQWRKPVRIFYRVRCFRYERPQAGRYREFTQFGLECLGGESPQDADEVIGLLQKCMIAIGIEVKFDSAAKRGLSYYVEDGFEVNCDALGAQKQVAGGGRYNEGIGWAIGVDRTVLAEQREGPD